MKELKNIKCPDSWFKLESKFTTWWLWELKKKWFWKKKWSDASRDSKPYDCNIATPFWDYYCEIKVIRSENFDLSIFRPNQIKALNDLSMLWRQAIVCLYSTKKNTYWIVSWKKLKNSFTF